MDVAFHNSPETKSNIKTLKIWSLFSARNDNFLQESLFQNRSWGGVESSIKKVTLGFFQLECRKANKFHTDSNNISLKILEVIGRGYHDANLR